METQLPQYFSDYTPAAYSRLLK